MDSERRSRLAWGYARVAIAALVVGCYVWALWARLPKSLPQPLRTLCSDARQELNHLCAAVLGLAGLDHPSFRLRHGTYLILTGVVIPWVVMVFLRRGGFTTIGLRRPNRLAWRIFLLGYLIALPVIVWMVQSPGFVPYYRPQFARAWSPFMTYYFVIMLAEHFLFHGVMLAAFRADWRWPPPPPLDCSRRSRFGKSLQWLGLAQPAEGARGHRRVTRWLGLPDGCLAAIVLSTALFGAIHWGKDPREFLLSFPGGVGFAFLAYRTNSWLTPFALHLATAGTACLLMVLMAQG